VGLTRLYLGALEPSRCARHHAVLPHVPGTIASLQRLRLVHTRSLSFESSWLTRLHLLCSQDIVFVGSFGYGGFLDEVLSAVPAPSRAQL
jgi:hypothetical protein